MTQLLRSPGRPKSPPLPAFPKPPTPAAIRAARQQAGLTMKLAGAVVYVKLRTWQNWEDGTNHMPPGLWELWLLKTVRARVRARVLSAAPAVTR